jgi:hypothetical protein
MVPTSQQRVSQKVQLFQAHRHCVVLSICMHPLWLGWSQNCTVQLWACAHIPHCILVAENHRRGIAAQDMTILLSLTFGYAWGYREIQSTSRQLMAGNERSEPYLDHSILKQAVDTDLRFSLMWVFSMAPDLGGKKIQSPQQKCILYSIDPNGRGPQAAGSMTNQPKQWLCKSNVENFVYKGCTR